jgi:3-hydroxyisobutyrate dehydrogenase-like beta-hydroxyacid dehydrogenase
MVGLGVMGSAMAGLLLRGGRQVTGYDIEPERIAGLAAAGGQAAGSAAEVAAACPVVLTSLPTPAAFHDVISGPAGLAGAGRAGMLVIELSTLSLADKDRGRRALEAAGGRLADVPVSGTGAQARSGDLVAFVSADRPLDRRRAIEVVAGFSRAQYDVGAFGNGSRFKYVANLLVAIHNVAAAEALVLAEQAGLDLGLVLAAVGAGAGGSRMLEIRGPLMAARSYDPTVRLEVFLKDVALITEFAADVGAPVPLLAASAEVYQAARAAGRSDQDTASVAEVLRERARRTGPGA